MNALIGKSKYLILIAVITLLITFFMALLWGVAKAISVWTVMVTTLGKSQDISLMLIELVDAFLLALVLYILAASIYRMFIGDPGLTSRLVASSLPELKDKLSGVIILVLVVRFSEWLFAGTMDAQQVLLLGIATALVCAVLVAFIHFTENEPHP